MIELDRKLHKDIKEYCQLNGLVMKDFVNKLLKKAFMVEKYGDKPFSSNDVVLMPYVPTLEATIEEPADVPPITNEKILEKYKKPIDEMPKEDISKKEVPNNLYGLITEIEPNGKIDENTEIVDMRSVISDGNDGKIILQPSKDGKSLVSHPETENVQEEMKPIKKSRKRKLN